MAETSVETTIESNVKTNRQLPDPEADALDARIQHIAEVVDTQNAKAVTVETRDMSQQEKPASEPKPVRKGKVPYETLIETSGGELTEEEARIFQGMEEGDWIPVDDSLPAGHSGRTRATADAIRQQQIEPDAKDEINIVEPVKEKERDAADKKEDIAIELWDLGTRAEGKRIKVENLSEKAMEQDETNDIAERTGGKTDRQSQLDTEREKIRQAELMEVVHSQFRVAGSKYHFKDQPDKLAFKDKGERMVSASNDDRVAKAMAMMSEAKGWQTIKVSGHPDFKREVWMEASLRGLEVRGYKPTEQELKILEERREREMRNAVQRDPSDRERPAARQAWRQKEEQKRKETHAKGIHSGRVLEHGEANYNHDPDEKKSYFVQLETAKGEKVIWGLDLKRAMEESKAKVGDEVNLEYKGKQAVIVEALKRDEKGKVIGKEEIETNRNTWEVQKSDRHQVVEAVASTLIDSRVENPAQREALKTAVGERLAERENNGRMPAVPVYDKEAPSKAQQQEIIGPVVELQSERTR